MLRLLLGCMDGPVRSQIGTFLTALHIIVAQLLFVADADKADGGDAGTAFAWCVCVQQTPMMLSTPHKAAWLQRSLRNWQQAMT